MGARRVCGTGARLCAVTTKPRLRTVGHSGTGALSRNRNRGDGWSDTASNSMLQFCRVRAGHDSGTCPRRPCAGKDEGKTLGRRKIAPTTEKAIRAALTKCEEGMHKIAARFGVGTGTVQRIKSEMAV
jgi:hypothetical protein